MLIGRDAQLNRAYEVITEECDTRDKWNEYCKKTKVRSRPIPVVIAEADLATKMRAKDGKNEEDVVQQYQS